MPHAQFFTPLIMYVRHTPVCKETWEIGANGLLVISKRFFTFECRKKLGKNLSFLTFLNDTSLEMQTSSLRLGKR